MSEYNKQPQFDFSIESQMAGSTFSYKHRRVSHQDRKIASSLDLAHSETAVDSSC
jgi:hypothetical protein